MFSAHDSDVNSNSAAALLRHTLDPRRGVLVLGPECGSGSRFGFRKARRYSIAGHFPDLIQQPGRVGVRPQLLDNGLFGGKCERRDSGDSGE